MALNEVHSGWLTKSPPNKKHQGRLKLFKAQWRRRYFVLSSCQSQSPGGDEEAPPVYYLHYYDNDKNPKKSRKKGCIDLSNCEEILAELESDGYKNVFSLRTQHKGKDRTYCLAADSPEEMNRWITCLTRNLQMNDSGSSVTSPGTPGAMSLSSTNRKASYPLIRKDPSTPGQQPSGLSSPSHLSMQVDTALNFSVELAEARLGPRGSKSYYSPINAESSSSCFQFFPPAVAATVNKDAVPPSLPAKAPRRGGGGGDLGGDPCSNVDGEAPSTAASLRLNDCGRPPPQDKEPGQQRMSEDLADYDVLPARFQKAKSSKDSDYDFPPFGLLSAGYGGGGGGGGGGDGGGGGGKAAKEVSSSDFRAQRDSASSQSDVFESVEDLVPHLNSEMYQLPESLHMTPRTRSFRRSSSSKSQTPMSTEQKAPKSSSEEGDDYEQLQKDDEDDYTDLLNNFKS